VEKYCTVGQATDDNIIRLIRMISKATHTHIHTNSLSLSLSLSLSYYVILGRDSSVGIATRYGLDGPGIESRWEAKFSARVPTSPGAHPAIYTVGTASFLGAKRPGRGVDHPPPSSAEVRERVELYLCSPFGPSWPVLG
jgi:hypothetical protein